jgi:hypothetical protein
MDVEEEQYECIEPETQQAIFLPPTELGEFPDVLNTTGDMTPTFLLDPKETKRLAM